MKKVLLLIWSFWLTATGAYAQQHPDHEQEEIQKCYTMESDSLLRKKYPQLGSLLDFERDLQLNISKVEERQKSDYYSHHSACNS
jgi:hypothetical protein